MTLLLQEDNTEASVQSSTSHLIDSVCKENNFWLLCHENVFLTCEIHYSLVDNLVPDEAHEI